MHDESTKGSDARDSEGYVHLQGEEQMDNVQNSYPNPRIEVCETRQTIKATARQFCGQVVSGFWSGSVPRLFPSGSIIHSNLGGIRTTAGSSIAIELALVVFPDPLVAPTSCVPIGVSDRLPEHQRKIKPVCADGAMVKLKRVPVRDTDAVICLKRGA